MLEFVLSGETSENLVRARRREVQKSKIHLTKSRSLGTSHWRKSEKADEFNLRYVMNYLILLKVICADLSLVPSRNIQAKQTS